MIKTLSRLLLLIILVCGLSIQASLVSGIAKPSAPEFTLEFVDSSYYVPPTYTIDQYTGKNVTDKPGHTVENKYIVITIKNPAFASSVNGKKYYMAYNVAVKGHFGEEWKGLDFTSKCTMTEYLSEDFPRASDSDYTILRVRANNYPTDTQLDVKVQAYIGHEVVIQVTDYFADRLIPMGSHDEDGIRFDTKGDWSEIQTITINVNAPTSEIHIVDVPTSETCQINFLILVGALILIPIAAGLGLLIYLNRRKRSN